MKKIILALVWCTVVFTPCLLMFCEGGYPLFGSMGINGPYLVQIIGLIYSFILLRYNRVMIPQWVRSIVDELVRDE
jgi:hypothetical protein